MYERYSKFNVPRAPYISASRVADSQNGIRDAADNRENRSVFINITDDNIRNGIIHTAFIFFSVRCRPLQPVRPDVDKRRILLRT